jgi:glucokinase
MAQPLPLFAGVDVGGSHFSVGLVDSSRKVLCSSSAQWDNLSLTPEVAVELIVQAISRLLQDLHANQTDQKPFQLCAVGIGCPGQAKDNILVAASNLPLFRNAPLAHLVSTALNQVPTILLNDADAAVCAEVWGQEEAYRGAKSVALLTLGTGIGFGLILNETLYQGSHGLLEAGHMIICTGSGTPRCGCGQSGCVEAYASARATAQRLEDYDRVDSKKSNTNEENDEGNKEKVDGKEVFARYAMNDFNAVKTVEEVGGCI